MAGLKISYKIMKILIFSFVLLFSTISNLSTQELELTLNAKDITNKIDDINATNTVTDEISSADGSSIIHLNSFSTDSIPAFSEPNQIKRVSFNLYFGLGGRVPLSDSYYNLWKDLAIGDANFEASDGLAKYISANWPDYFFSFLRADLDFLISEHLSIGIFAYPDKYKKTISFSDETDNWTGNGSNGLEDHWELSRRLRIATYNFGPNIKFKVPFNNWELNMSYLYGWSYLWRSSFEFSYYNQQTGTGEKGFLGLVFASDGNLTKLRYNGNSDFHRVELGITRYYPEKKGGSVTMKVGYQFLQMDNISYEVLKYGSEDFSEASRYFDTRGSKEYQVGDGGDIYIDNDKFNLDLRSFYISLGIGLHSQRKKMK